MIEALGSFGTVLTEHIGSIGLTSSGESEKTSTYIFERDIAWITEADVIVAEVTSPSLGVGYELAKSESLGKKVLCLFRPSPERRLSAMVEGNAYFQIQHYATIEDVRTILSSFFADKS